MVRNISGCCWYNQPFLVCVCGGWGVSVRGQFLPSALLRQSLSGFCFCAVYSNIAGLWVSSWFSCLHLPFDPLGYRCMALHPAFYVGFRNQTISFVWQALLPTDHLTRPPPGYFHASMMYFSHPCLLSTVFLHFSFSMEQSIPQPALSRVLLYNVFGLITRFNPVRGHSTYHCVQEWWSYLPVLSVCPCAGWKTWFNFPLTITVTLFQRNNNNTVFNFFKTFLHWWGGSEGKGTKHQARWPKFILCDTQWENLVLKVALWPLHVLTCTCAQCNLNFFFLLAYIIHFIFHTCTWCISIKFIKLR